MLLTVEVLSPSVHRLLHSRSYLTVRWISFPPHAPLNSLCTFDLCVGTHAEMIGPGYPVLPWHDSCMCCILFPHRSPSLFRILNHLSFPHTPPDILGDYSIVHIHIPRLLSITDCSTLLLSARHPQFFAFLPITYPPTGPPYLTTVGILSSFPTNYDRLNISNDASRLISPCTWSLARDCIAPTVLPTHT